MFALFIGCLILMVGTVFIGRWTAEDIKEKKTISPLHFYHCSCGWHYFSYTKHPKFCARCGIPLEKDARTSGIPLRQAQALQR